MACVCYDGFWLGMLSHEQLYVIDEYFYEGRGSTACVSTISKACLRRRSAWWNVASCEGGVLLSFYHRSMRRCRSPVAALVVNTLRQVRGKPRVEVGDGLEPDYVHYFTQQEVSRELRAVGFEPVYYSGGAYGYALGQVTESRKAHTEVSPPTRDITQRVHA